MKRLPLALCAILLLAGGPVHGHHSFAADYFEQQIVTVKGEVVEFDYRSPHSWVHVMVTDEEGRPQRLAAEWAGVGRLTRDDITRETLRKGDLVVISGSPGRNPADRKIHLKAIERPADGWKWSRRP